MAKFSNVNQLPATGPLAMYSVKTVLVNAGWTVTRSGDGLSLYSSSGDILTTGASGAGGLGNARAYFNVRDPAARVSFSFQMITNTTWRVKYSESAGFTGGTPTFQTVASATDETVLYGAGTDASPTGTQMLHTDNLYRFHIVAQSTAQTGSNTYPFWFGCTVNGTGVCASLFMLEGMANNTYNTLDQAPRVIITWYVAGGPVMIGWSNSSDANFYTRGWILYGLAGATFARFGVAVYTSNIIFNTSLSALVSPVTAGSFFNFSPYNSAEDQPVPCLIGRTANHGSLPGLKGYCSEVKLGTASGHTYPSTINFSTNCNVSYGGFLLQWPESVAPLL
jgi:hypothetical protein